MNRTLRQFTTSLAVAGLAAGAPAGAQVRIHATSITSGDILAYYGLGDLGGGVGHGTYQLGTCSFGAVRSSCTTSGTYVETAASVNPGATGTFFWRMTWLGNVPNPIQARSVSPGSNNLGLHSVPAGAYFEVLLGNGLYANLDFGVKDTPNPQGGALNWQAFLTPNASCTGNPPVCSVGNVGLNAGTSISSVINAFDMQLDYPNAQVPTTTPEPATLVLLAAGIGALGIVRRRRG